MVVSAHSKTHSEHSSTILLCVRTKQKTPDWCYASVQHRLTKCKSDLSHIARGQLSIDELGS